MGYTFDIGIWLTYELAIYGNGDPEKALKKFIPENFKEAGHSIDLTIHSTNPAPPYESYNADHWPAEDDPCGISGTFNDLMDWWDVWHSCNGTTHADANVLVTDYDSTAGLTIGDCDQSQKHLCVAEASKIGDLADENVDSYGHEMRYSQMYATVLHEIGHAVLNEEGTFSCSDSSVEEERAGDSWSVNNSDKVKTTPMVTWDNKHGSKNLCCTDLAAEPSSDDNKVWTRSYSSCVQDHLVNCANKY